MGDRRISRKLKGNMLRSCVTPAYMNDTNKNNRRRFSFAKNNLVIRIVGAKRVDEIRMGGLSWSEGKV